MEHLLDETMLHGKYKVTTRKNPMGTCMSILFGKNYSKIFVSETNGPITFGLGMSH